jgi:hypothetical protein
MPLAVFRCLGTVVLSTVVSSTLLLRAHDPVFAAPVLPVEFVGLEGSRSEEVLR